MAELSSGKIIIDGHDIALLGLGRLRQALSVVPRQPVLFSGSIRKNLDPLSQHSDEQVLRVLKLVKLESAARAIQGAKEQTVAVDVRDLSGMSVGTGSSLVLMSKFLHYLLILAASVPSVSVSGLDGSLLENGGNISVGQRQLFCLARALLQSSKIVFLEEAATSDSTSVEATIHRVSAAGHAVFVCSGASCFALRICDQASFLAPLTAMSWHRC